MSDLDPSEQTGPGQATSAFNNLPPLGELSDPIDKINQIKVYQFQPEGLQLGLWPGTDTLAKLPIATGTDSKQQHYLSLQAETGFPAHSFEITAPWQLWVSPTGSYLSQGPTSPVVFSHRQLFSADGQVELRAFFAPLALFLCHHRSGRFQQICPDKHTILAEIQLPTAQTDAEEHFEQTREQTRKQTREQTCDFAYDLPRRRLWISDGSSVLSLWHLDSGRLSQFDLQLGGLGALALSTDGAYLLLQSGDTCLSYLDLARFEVLKTCVLSGGDRISPGALLSLPQTKEWAVPITTASGQAGLQWIQAQTLQMGRRFITHCPAPVVLAGFEVANPSATLATSAASILAWRSEQPNVSCLLPEQTQESLSVLLQILYWQATGLPVPQIFSAGQRWPERIHQLWQGLESAEAVSCDFFNQTDQRDETGQTHQEPLKLTVTRAALLALDQKRRAQAEIQGSSAETDDLTLPGQSWVPLVTQSRLALLGPNQELLQALDLKPLGLLNPIDLRLLPDQHFLVTDAASARVCAVSARAEITWEIGPEQGLIGPVKATWYEYQGQIRYLIVDMLAGRVFETDAEYQIYWEYSDLKHPCDLQRTHRETYLVTDSGLGLILEINAQAEVIQRFAAPDGQALQSPMFARLDPAGQLVIYDQAASQLILHSPTGEVHTREITEKSPYFLSWDRHSSLLWASPGELLWLEIPTAQTLKRLQTSELAQSTPSAPALRDLSQEQLAFLESLPFFAACSDQAAFAALAEALQPLSFRAGQALFKAGDRGEALYILQSGEVELLREDQQTPLLRLESGDIFGELALIFETPRTRTVRARSEVKVLSLNKRAFYKLSRSYPFWLNHFKQLAEQHKYREQIRQMDRIQAEADQLKSQFAGERLRQLSLFQDLEPAIVETLIAALQCKHYAPDTWLFQQGDQAQELFFISKGKLAVFEDGELINTMPEGEVLGEIALVLDRPRTASVQIQTEAELYTLERAAFLQAFAESPSLKARLESIAEQRLARSASQNFGESTATRLDQIQPLPKGYLTETESAPLHSPCFVLDPHGARALELDSSGQVVWQYGQQDHHLLLNPAALIETAQSLLIVDRGNHRVLELDKDTRQPLQEWGDQQLNLLNPTAAWSGGDGTIWIADQGHLRLLHCQGKEILWSYHNPQQLLSPVWLEVTPQERILWVDDMRHQVVLMDRSGTVHWSYGTPLHPGNAYFQLKSPRSATYLANGHVLIADTGNHRVLEIDPQGQIVWNFSGSPEHPLLAPLRAERQGGKTRIFANNHQAIWEVNQAGQVTRWLSPKAD